MILDNKQIIYNQSKNTASSGPQVNMLFTIVNLQYNLRIHVSLS
jgi:hypothetical protein